jgi:hypothetical protein
MASNDDRVNQPENTGYPGVLGRPPWTPSGPIRGSGRGGQSGMNIPTPVSRPPPGNNYSVFRSGGSNRGGRVTHTPGWANQRFEWNGDQDQTLYDNRHQYARAVGTPEWRRLIQMSLNGGGERLSRAYAVGQRTGLMG